MEFVLLPKITEKTLAEAAANNTFALVARGKNRVTKTAVRRYVEENFKVAVVNVNGLNRLGKTKRFGKIRGEYKREDQNLFYVKLKQGDTIPGFDFGKEKGKEKSK